MVLCKNKIAKTTKKEHSWFFGFWNFLRGVEQNYTTTEEGYYWATKKAFDVVAPFYDILVRPLSRVWYKAVDVANVKLGSKILDAGLAPSKIWYSDTEEITSIGRLCENHQRNKR